MGGTHSRPHDMCLFWSELTILFNTRTFRHMCLDPFYLALELSILLGPVQNQNLHSRGPTCAAHLAQNASLALCKQEITLDIALDTEV